MAMANRIGSSTQSGAHGADDDAPPALPSRTGTGVSARGNGNGDDNGHGHGHGGRALMDEADEHSMNGLSGWEVLKPA
jgi:hypothetical protein